MYRRTSGDYIFEVKREDGTVTASKRPIGTYADTPSEPLSSYDELPSDVWSGFVEHEQYAQICRVSAIESGIRS